MAYQSVLQTLVKSLLFLFVGLFHLLHAGVAGIGCNSADTAEHPNHLLGVLGHSVNLLLQVFAFQCCELLFQFRAFGCVVLVEREFAFKILPADLVLLLGILPRQFEICRQFVRTRFRLRLQLFLLVLGLLFLQFLDFLGFLLL